MSSYRTVIVYAGGFGAKFSVCPETRRSGLCRAWWRGKPGEPVTENDLRVAGVLGRMRADAEDMAVFEADEEDRR